MKLLIIALLLFPSLAWAAIPTINSTSSTFGNATTHTFAHTVNAGSDRALYVHVIVRDSSATIISTVTYDGVGLTELSQLNQGGVSTMGVYEMSVPPVGTANVVVTLGSSNKASMGAVTIDGTSGLGDTDYANGSGTSTSSSITTLATDSLILAVEGHADTVSYTLDSNYTSQYTEITTGNPAGGNVRITGSTRDAATIQAYSISSALGGTDSWHSTQLEVQDGAGPTPTPTPVPPVGPPFGSLSLSGAGR